jgi:MFS family permease
VLPGVTSAISLAAEDHEQGAVAGLSNSAQGLGRLIGPLLGTSLYELRQELPYATAAFLVALSLLFVVGSPQMRALARRHREAALG